jgi:hypothetical protein
MEKHPGRQVTPPKNASKALPKSGNTSEGKNAKEVRHEGKKSKQADINHSRCEMSVRTPSQKKRKEVNDQNVSPSG